MAVSNDVKIVITATDKTKGAIDSATGGVSSLGKSVKDLQPQFAKAAAMGTVAFGAISAAVGISIKAFGEAERSQRQLEHAVLDVSKGTRDQVKAIVDISEALQKKVGIDGDALKMGAAQLSTFGLQSKSVIDLTKSLADLTVNQSGVNAAGEQYVQSANMIAKALRGEFGMLEKNGIRFTEAQQSIILYGTEVQKVAAIQEGFAQNLRETTDTLGGVDSATAKLKISFGEIQESIGKAFLPVIVSISETITPLLISLGEWISANPELTRQIILASLAITGLVAVVGTLGLLIPIVVAGFTALAGPVGIIIAIIIGLTVAVTNVVNIVRILQTDWKNVLEGMKLIAQEKIQPIIDLFNKLKDLIDSVISGIGRAASAASSKLSSAVSSISGRRASGGPVGGGSSYIVGEQGPEIFRPKVAGDIIPNGRSGGMSLIINITGNTLLDEFAGEKIAVQIMRAVKSNVRV